MMPNLANHRGADADADAIYTPPKPVYRGVHLLCIYVGRNGAPICHGMVRDTPNSYAATTVFTCDTSF